MTQLSSSLDLGFNVVRNAGLALGVALWIRALANSLKGTVVSRTRAKRAFRFGIGPLVLGGLAELVLVQAGKAPITSKGCMRSGADVVCLGHPMVRVREVDGWKVVLDEAAQTLRAEREGVGGLFISTFISDRSSVAELAQWYAQEMTRLADGGDRGCAVSKEGVMAGGKPGVAVDCFRDPPMRSILVQRGLHVYASLQCIGPPGACDPVLRNLEWVRPEDPNLGALF